MLIHHPKYKAPTPPCNAQTQAVRPKTPRQEQSSQRSPDHPEPPTSPPTKEERGEERGAGAAAPHEQPQPPPAHNEHPRHLPGCTELREAQGTGLYRAPQARYYRHWGSSPSAVPHRGSYRSPGRVPPVPSLPFPSILGVSTGPLRAHPRPPSTVPGLASAPPAQLRDPTGNHRAGPIPERRHRGSRPRSPLTTEALPVPVQPAAGQKSRPGGRGTEA